LRYRRKSNLYRWPEKGCYALRSGNWK